MNTTTINWRLKSLLNIYDDVFNSRINTNFPSVFGVAYHCDNWLDTIATGWNNLLKHEYLFCTWKIYVQLLLEYFNSLNFHFLFSINSHGGMVDYFADSTISIESYTSTIFTLYFTPIVLPWYEIVSLDCSSIFIVKIYERLLSHDPKFGPFMENEISISWVNCACLSQKWDSTSLTATMLALEIAIFQREIPKYERKPRHKSPIYMWV